MRYYGGKYRTGKEIAKILKELVEERKIKGYIEPFCGALGVMRHMINEKFPCYASDGCEDVIMLWKDVQRSKFNNPCMTKEKWLELKKSNIPSSDRAFAAFGCSYGGQWFQGYVGDYDSSGNLDSVYRGVRNMGVNTVTFSHKDYKEINVELGGYLVYCDPPYIDGRNTFGSSFTFDTVEFWNTVRRWRSLGNIVVVSERSAPKDFDCIWSKKLSSIGSSDYVDKLFI